MQLREVYHLVTFLITLFLASFLINLFQVATFVLLYPWPQTRSLANRQYQKVWTWVMDLLVGTPRFEVVGDAVRPEDNCVVISNHQIDSDWWWLWQWLMVAYARQGDVKIAMKDSLKFVPVFGWGMYFFEFVFLSRNWAKDERVLVDTLTHFAKQRYPLLFILFPEGTTIYQEAVMKSKTFSKQQGRPEFDLLLLPRVKGLMVTLASLGSPVLYDVTHVYESFTGEVPTNDMGYTRNTDTLVPSFADIMCKRKRLPTIYLHVKRRDLTGVDVHDEARFTEWIDAVWKEKEQRLRRFITHGTLVLDTDKKCS